MFQNRLFYYTLGTILYTGSLCFSQPVKPTAPKSGAAQKSDALKAKEEKNTGNEDDKPQQVLDNVGYLFETGFNLGSLEMSYVVGVNIPQRANYANAAARFFSKSFEPDLEHDPPTLHPAVIARYQKAVMQKVVAHSARSQDPLVRIAPDLTNAGYHLARAQALSIAGKKPYDMGKEMSAAGKHLLLIGRVTQSSNLMVIGKKLNSYGKQVSPFLRTSETQEYYQLILQASALVRSTVITHEPDEKPKEAEKEEVKPSEAP